MFFFFFNLYMRTHQTEFGLFRSQVKFIFKTLFFFIKIAQVAKQISFQFIFNMCESASFLQTLDFHTWPHFKVYSSRHASVFLTKNRFDLICLSSPAMNSLSAVCKYLKIASDICNCLNFNERNV